MTSFTLVSCFFLWALYVFVDKRRVYLSKVGTLFAGKIYVMFNAFDKRRLHVVLEKAHAVNFTGFVFATEIF
jgi:hypothetical protein